ncbi:12429_t:CDS:2, partial [Racocetra fulgida]
MVKWKREREDRIVKDYKYDFVDVHEFEQHDCFHKDRENWKDKVAFYVFFAFKDRILDANTKGQTKGQQPTLPTLVDDYALPQYNGPPDQLKYNVGAEKQGYYVQNPNIYDQQRDSISSNPVRESSPVPHFHNYNIPR